MKAKAKWHQLKISEGEEGGEKLAKAAMKKAKA